MATVVGTWLGVLELCLATGVVAVIIVSLSRRDRASQSLGDSLVVPAAALSFGSAAVHLWVVPTHVAEYQPHGLAFLVLAIFQARWAAVYLGRRPAWLLRLGLVINVGVVAIWVWSRTSGLPWGAAPWVPETIGGADLVATAFEIALISILALQLWPARQGFLRRPLTSRSAGDLRALAVAAVCVFTFLAATAPPNGHVEEAGTVSPSPAP